MTKVFMKSGLVYSSSAKQCLLSVNLKKFLMQMEQNRKHKNADCQSSQEKIWHRKTSSLRGRRSKGKEKGIRARDHARGRRGKGNACKETIVFAIPPTN